ncbi:hypothetical protein BJX70DRAFT_397734 [Aspergillus crustosus]
MPAFLPVLLGPLLASTASAVPSAPAGSNLARGENVLLFDAPAYETTTCPVRHLSTVQAYTYNNGSVDAVANVFHGFLSASGIEVDEQRLEILRSRSKYFATTPIGGKIAQIEVDGARVVSLLARQQFQTIALMMPVLLNIRVVSALSGKEGWGVISDIDDTIKISGHGIDAVTATLIDEATPVSGIPAVYSTLTELIDPAWIYLTGSPWQLYGMLHDFIHTYFSESTGPILMKNLTYTGVEGLLEFLAEGTSLEYKAGKIDDIHSWHPKKQYLGIGDSSGNDPEAYAYAYRQYGSAWMKCIWIHVVEEGNNTAARWTEAFKGIPRSVYQLYTSSSELNPEALLEGDCF